MLAGLLACFLASIILGTLFVPIKFCPPTDGFATQLFMCLGAYLTSFALYAYLQFPGLYTLPMFGGMLWATTNSIAVPIMSRVGMAMFMLFASSISCLIGWAVSRFGLFGVPPTIPASVTLNFAGIALLIIGAAIYPFIKVDLPPSPIQTNQKSKDTLDLKLELGLSWIGVIATGISLGLMTTPVTLIMTRRDLYPWAPESSISLHFSFFTGVTIISILIFLLYAILKRSSPQLPAIVVLPATLSGVFIASAMACFFIANELLSPTISYPICMMAPGLVTSAWSVLYFREITGSRNLLILLSAYAFTLLGVIVITISRDFSYF